MATIDISGINEVKAMIATLGDEMDQVNQLSQNKMAYQIWAAEKDQMASDLDRPKPWSLNALRYKKAGVPDTSAPPVEGAAVYMVDQFSPGSRVGEDEWLGVQVIGTQTAGPRRSEIAMINAGFMDPGDVWVPADIAPLDSYGNVSGTMIKAMIEDLSTEKPKKYALIGPRGNRKGVIRNVYGVWLPFLWFVSRRQYRARFDFHGRARREVDKDYLRHVSYYLDEAIRRMA